MVSEMEIVFHGYCELCLKKKTVRIFRDMALCEECIDKLREYEGGIAYA